MAYLDLHIADHRSGPAVSMHDARPFAGLFGREERIALQVAERDEAASIDHSDWRVRLRGRLFGIEAPTPFADASLEAIRRLGITARRGGRKALISEVAAARHVGLSATKIDAVLLAFGRIVP